MIGIYAATFALCFLLSVGVGLIIQATDNGSKRLLLQYVGQIMVMGTVIYVVLFGLLAFGAMLIINFLFVDKPFKFWDKKETVTIEDVYEPYLMQIGFLARTPRGRCVTKAAYDHLGVPFQSGGGSAQVTIEEDS